LSKRDHGGTRAWHAGTGDPAAEFPLPALPAMLSTADGTVVRVTEQLLRLAGQSSPEAFTGRKLSHLLVRKGNIAQLVTPGGRLPVRLVSWPHAYDEDLNITVLVDISDLTGEQHHEPVRETEHYQLQRLLATQRMAKLGSWAYYPETGEFYLSEVTKEFFAAAGYEQPEDPRDAANAVHPADRPLIEKFLAQLREADPDTQVEQEIRSLDGSRIYQCTARVERDRAGNIIRVFGTTQDITEHRQLQNQLLNERRKLEEAQRIAHLGTWEWEPLRKTFLLSPMLREVLGENRSRISFNDYLNQVHPDDRDYVRKAWRPLAQHRQPVEVEHRYLLADGSVRLLRVHGQAVSHGGHWTVVGTAQDVTEQRAVIARLQRTTQRFSDLVAITPVGIGLFDASGERLVDANKALCDLLGYQIEELRGMSIGELTHPAELEQRLPRPPRQDQPHRVLQRIMLRSDGEPVYCELHVTLSVQDDGTQFWLVAFQDITERRRTAEALRYQATHDDLTGLPNRSAVKDLLRRLWQWADTHSIAVLYCDIDNFKRINDSLGHDAGDELLVALANRLEEGLPPGCIPARISGDEFVIICQDLEPAGGIDELISQVAALLRTPVPVGGQLLRVTASIGAAMPNGATRHGEDLLRFADAAMYEAKQRGSGKITIASPDLIANANHQMQLEGELREALHRDELVLHYQPVVDSDGWTISAEALLRWQHPERGFIGPNVFIPVAEQGDLLPDLDRWVLRTALAEARTWPAVNGKPVRIAVNLAGLVPGTPGFVEAITDIINESGIDQDRVVLELVETTVVDLPARPRREMRELGRQGVRFAVDDFGTGYSSLARLKDLPAQIIKIDRRFVAGVGDSGPDYAVARAAVDMTRAMGRECVAEGVETPTQFRLLAEAGAHAHQGWLFSPAVPAEEFRHLMRQNFLQTVKA